MVHGCFSRGKSLRNSEFEMAASRLFSLKKSVILACCSRFVGGFDRHMGKRPT